MNTERLLKSFVEKKVIKDFKEVWSASGHTTELKITFLDNTTSVYNHGGRIVMSSKIEDTDHEIVNGRDCDGTPYN